MTDDNHQTSLKHLEKAIELSRTFTVNNFDLDGMLNMFLDTLTEITGVGRASLLLLNQEEGIYRIKVSKGLFGIYFKTLSLI